MAIVIGVNPGHDSSVALSVDGRVVFAANEERLRRAKGYTGYPELSLAHCYALVDKSEVDRFALVYDSAFDMRYLSRAAAPTERNGYERWRARAVAHFGRPVHGVGLDDLLSWLELPFFAEPRLRRAYLARKLGVSAEKIVTVEHHTCHARSASFCLPADRDWLIFTADGEGDRACAAVSTRHLGTTTLLRLSSVPRQHSLGLFFSSITEHLGMNPNEHEYKVMGLEPYARKTTADHARVLAKLASLFSFEGDDWKAAHAMLSRDHRAWLERELRHERFDYVASAAQKTLEGVITTWIKNWIVRTGIRHIAVAGGVFMNVKLNQRLYDLPEVESLHVVPSAGDETTVLGACNQVNVDLTGDELRPLEDLYLGNEHDEASLCAFAGSIDRARYDVERIGADIEAVVARLLARGTIVARFAGRMEFGARALGNRSILAHPRDAATVRRINALIKDRDFWMPFTPSILAEEAHRIIRNPRGLVSPFMAITFDATDQAKQSFAAAIHPYDDTMRVQMVSERSNPRYHRLLACFHELTGIAGVLNTSLNLHGMPIVSSPADCMEVMDRSGLTHLALGEHLITKKG